MKTVALGLCGVLTLGALSLTGCNAEQDSAVVVSSTHTVVRTITATAAAPDTSTQAPRHTASSKGTERAKARAAQPLAAPRSTTTATRPKASPAPVRTTQPPRQTTVRAPAPAPVKTTASAASCNIKGNISSKGEKIYHVPGQRYYNVTKISPAKGERWFCSEQDALSAGWRKALV